MQFRETVCMYLLPQVTHQINYCTYFSILSPLYTEYMILKTASTRSIISPQLPNYFALFPNSSSDPRLVTAWPDNAILKIESIPHHFTAFSIRNCGRQPTLIVHCLDYVSQ